MAEAILFEALPEIALEAFLGFKAMIKRHVNNVDMFSQHELKIESYAMKTTLFWCMETIPQDFWNDVEDLTMSQPGDQDNQRLIVGSTNKKKHQKKTNKTS